VAVDGDQKARLRALPNIAELRDLRPPRGRGPLYGAVFPVPNRLRKVRELGVTGLPIMTARFAAQS
jgi:hypothetical protein